MQHIVWRHISIISSCFTLGVSFHLSVCLFVCLFVLYRPQFTLNSYQTSFIRFLYKSEEKWCRDKPKVKGQGHNWYRVTNYINRYNFWTKRAREMGPGALESLNSGLPVVCGPCCSKTSRFSAKWRQRKVPIVIFKGWWPLSDFDWFWYISSVFHVFREISR